MLVISRRVGGVLYISPIDDLPPGMTVKELFAGGQIAVEIIEFHDKQVRIGIDAPKQFKILRDDVKKKQ